MTRTLPSIFRKCSKITEEYRSFQEDPKKFRSYTNESKYNLRDKLDIREIIDIFTSEDMKNTPPESRMWFVSIVRVVYLKVNALSEWIIGIYLHEFPNNELEI